MKRRLMLATWMLLVVAGCNSSSSPDSSAQSGAAPPASAVAQGSDPAALAAHEFLDAVVKGDTPRANQLLTPLAIEKIAASGKPFQLPGMANYSFRVGEVRYPSADKAFVQCMGTDRSAEGTTVQEEFCWVLSLVERDWRVAGIIYTAGPQQRMMIYSFEDPEKGAVPMQQLMPQAAGQTADTDSAPQQPTYPPTQSHVPDDSTQLRPQTAQEPASAASYR